MVVKSSRAASSGAVLLCLLLGAVAPGAWASERALDNAMKTQLGANKQDVASQNKIDAVAENTQRMLQEYKLVLRQTESLQVYNKHLERLTLSQQEELVSIKRQLDELEFTSQGIVPLMVRMVEALESFVALDVPFLLDERRERVKTLNQNMDRADVSIAEKYRRIMEAYQVEMEYGRSIEAYTDTLDTGGESRSVNYLRVGRVAYMYQTLDGAESGIWNAQAREWRTLPDEYRSSIRDGLRTARKQQAPDLLKLPIRAPERVQ